MEVDPLKKARTVPVGESQDDENFQEAGLAYQLLRTTKLLAWNYRGLGNALVVRGLQRCQKAEQADILFLSEIKLDTNTMKVFK